MARQAESIEFEIPEGKTVLGPFLGPQDGNRKLLERRLGIKISARGTKLTVRGPQSSLAKSSPVIAELLAQVRKGSVLFPNEIDRVIRVLESGAPDDLARMANRPIAIGAGKKPVAAKSITQQAYIEAMQTKDLVFAVGPAGTGKTYLAMAAAVSALKSRAVERIILARPAVEAGERLGFLPGTLVDKVNPYLRPLHDAMFDLLGIEQAGKLMDSGVIEMAPLAFMRGRTLNRAFVVLDEAQNTTREQMKMFLTRLGYGSQAVVTGDLTQVDLERGQRSGLIHAVRILDDVEEVGIVKLTVHDVVRHRLVRAVVAAYDRDDAEESH